MWLTQDKALSPLILDAAQEANHSAQPCLSFSFCEVWSITSAQPPTEDCRKEIKKMEVLCIHKYTKGRGCFYSAVNCHGHLFHFGS